ncbi:ATP-grasp fold amidoligase family protein [Vibrio sp. PNB22_2_2]
MASLSYRLFAPIVSAIPLKTRVSILYFRRFKALPKLDNPVSFNEKIQRRKIYDRNNLLPVLADKIASKEYVREILGEEKIYIPKTIWESDNIDDFKQLNLKSLPRDYVYKANHTSQTIEIVRNGHHIGLDKMTALATAWLKHDQSKTLGEWAYSNIPRKVFIEEFLDFEGTVPDDYKFFVYHGKVHFIQVDKGRFVNHTRNMYDARWNDLGFEYSHPKSEFPLPKPPFIDEMISLAEELACNIDFLRVDFYFYRGRVTFGEITIYPGAGFEKFPSKSLDEMFGLPW